MNSRTSSLLLGGVLAACASAPATPAPTADPAPAEAVRAPAQRSLLEGLVAAGRGEFAAAARALAAAAERCSGTDVGTHARIALLGVLLDPRNPGRDPERARRVAEAHLRSSARPLWAEPVVKALYLASLDLRRAPSASAAGSGWESTGLGHPSVGLAQVRASVEPREPPAPKACDSGPPALAIDRTALPALPGRPLWQSLDVAMRERSVWRDSLTALLERNAELQAELARIQKALEP